jgi:hypothetical protein
MRTSVYLLSIALLVAAAGCSDKGEAPGMNILELESADVSFGAEGGTRHIVVKSTGSVTAASAVTWCAVAAQGNRVEVTVPVNDSLLARSTAVTLISAGKMVQVPVLQSGVQIEVARSVAIDAREQDVVLPFKSSRPVIATTNVLWLSFPLIVGDRLVMHASANTFTVERTATVTITAVTAGLLEARITVTQSVP